MAKGTFNATISRISVEMFIQYRNFKKKLSVHWGYWSQLLDGLLIQPRFTITFLDIVVSTITALDASNLLKCFGHHGTINEMCILLQKFVSCLSIEIKWWVT